VAFKSHFFLLDALWSKVFLFEMAASFFKPHPGSFFLLWLASIPTIQHHHIEQ